MSQAVNETMPIGPVQAYWGDVALGSPKTQATVRYSETSVQYGLEDSPVNSGSYKSKEIAEVDLVVADLKMSQLQRIYAQAASMSQRSTVFAAGYVAASGTVIMFKEEVKLSGTAPVTLGQASIYAAGTGTVKVYKSDLTNAPDGYAKVTDWSITNVAGGIIKRKGASTIPTGATVIVHYPSSQTASVALVGGKFADLEMPLRLVHYLDTGKALQFYAPRAKKIGASDVAIQMAAAFGGIPLTFHLLGDMTQAPGKQLFYWAKEA